MIYGIMKRIKVTLKNLSNRITKEVFVGMVEDVQREVSYKDEDGTLNYINFMNTDTLIVKRVAKDYVTNLVLNKANPGLVIKSPEGTMELPVKVLALGIKENRIYACYDTGERIEIIISLIKE